MKRKTGDIIHKLSRKIMEDLLGLSVTCTSLQALKALNSFIDADLYYRGPSPRALLEAASEASDTPMLFIYAAIMQLYADSHEAPALAQALIKPALSCIRNQRETLWLEVLQSWILGDFTLSIKQLLSLTTAYPRDLVAARLGIVHCLMVGDHPHMLDFAGSILSVPEHMTNPPALSFVSFCYLENDDLTTAERYVRAALVLEPHLAWAQHNLAHIFATRDQYKEGLEALQGHEGDWEGHFIKAHCQWHKAIFHILLGEPQQALRIYSDVLLPMNWWHVVSLVNLLSLLMYLDLYVENVQELITAPLLARLRCREKWGLDALVDLMTVWALAKAGDTETASSLAQLERPKHAELWRVGCNAMFLLNRGDRQGASALIKPIFSQLLAFGGSNEQRKALIDACLLTRADINSVV